MSIFNKKEEIIKDIMNIRYSVNESDMSEDKKEKIIEELNDLQDKIFNL